MAYSRVEVIEVLAWGKRVGAVALDPRSNYYVFEYSPNWRRRGIELAPTTMPTNKTKHVFTTLSPDTFQRLPAMLADSLPDDFGAAITTAYLVNEGQGEDAISSLDRLAYMGSTAMGALEFRPARGPRTRTSTHLDPDDLVATTRMSRSTSVEDASLDDETSVTDAISRLTAVGTSAGGARPKAVIAWNPDSDKFRTGQVPTDPGYEHWLLKLDGVGIDADLSGPGEYGRIEYAYYLMASSAGITMSDSRLLHEGGRAHFMTKRFDRADDGAKVHMQTLCALGHLDFRLIGTHDYTKLFEMHDQLGLGPHDRAETFKRMVFNVAAANCDDHPKNFSFLLAEGGTWALAPAYDMTHAHNPRSKWTSQHLMSVNGRSSDITANDLATVGDRFAVPSPSRLVAQVLDAVASWSEFAETAGVSDTARTEIAADIRTMTSPLR